MARSLEDLLADLVHLHRQPVRHGGEDRRVDAHAGLFHAQQDRDQRQIDVAIDLGRPQRLHVLFEHRRESPDSIRRCRQQLIPRRRQRPAAKARHNVGERVGGVGWVDEVGIEHQVIDRTREPHLMSNPMGPEDTQRCLEVVQRFWRLLVGQQGTQGLRVIG